MDAMMALFIWSLMAAWAAYFAFLFYALIAAIRR